MALNLKNEETDRLARQVSDATGETITQAVTVALRERLERLRARSSRRRLADELDAIGRRCASLPVLDHRPEEEILGYDDRGLPD